MRRDGKGHAPQTKKEGGSSDVCSQEGCPRLRGTDAKSEPIAKTVPLSADGPLFITLVGSDGGCNSVNRRSFPNAVVRAMTLLDECGDDIETAQMLARMRLRIGDLDEVIWWGEVLEALRVNQRNQA